MDSEQSWDDDLTEVDGDLCPPSAELSGDDVAGSEVTLKKGFGHFEIHEELGRGGMGTVFKARQKSPERWVALKMIQAGGFATEMFRRRFKLEADAIARLKHPNIVAVFESGEIDGVPYFTMPLIEGTVFPCKAAEGIMELRARVKLLLKVIDAVGHAHQHGILHRDLKPANILLDQDGEPFVADFGLAKLMDGGPDLTLPGAMMGSSSSMAPEQAAGKMEKISTATDIFGIGTILYQSLVGKTPFTGDNAAQVIEKLLFTEPDNPMGIDSTVDRDLTAICMKCLEKEPDDRYQSADALRRELQRWLNHEPIEARPITLRVRLLKWVKRNPAIAILTSALVMASAIGIAAFAVQYGKYFDQLVELKTREAERASTEGDVGVALAHWAGLLRFDPDNDIAIRRTQDLLVNRNFARPLILERGAEVVAARYVQAQGRLLVVTTDGEVTVRDGDSLDLFSSIAVKKRALGACLSHAGDQLAIGTGDSMIEFHRMPDGRPLGTVRAVKPVFDMHYSAQGDRLFTRTTNGVLQLWNTATLNEIELEGVRSNSVTARYTLVQLDAAGRYGVAYARPRIRFGKAQSDFHRIEVWRLSDGSRSQSWKVPEVQVRDIAFNAGAEQLAISTDGSGVEFRDLATGEKVLALPESQDAIRQIVFGRNGELMAAADKDGVVRVWNIGKRETVAVFELNSMIQSMRFHADSGLLVVVTEDHRVKVWDVDAQQAYAESVHQTHALENAWIVGANRNLLTVSVEGETALWRIEPSQVSMSVGAKVCALNYRPDGVQLLAGTYNSNVIIWDAVSGAEAAVLPHSNKVYCATFNPTGDRIVSGGKEGLDRLWSNRSKKGWNLWMTVPAHRNSVHCMSFSPDGRHVLSGGNDSIATYWRVTNPSDFVGPYTHGGLVVALDFSPGGTNFVTGSQSGHVMLAVTDNRTNVYRRTLRGTIKDVGFSSDGKRLFGASIEGELVVWNAKEFDTATHSGKLFAHDTEVTSADFSPDSNRIASGCRDGTVRIWDIESERIIGNPMMHEETVEGVRFTGDGRLLVSWSQDGTARVWDAVTCSAMSSPLPHVGGIFSGDLSPDGVHFATGGQEQSVRIWQIDGFPKVSDTEALARQAEIIGGFRFNDSGQLESIPLEDRFGAEPQNGTQ